MTALEHLCVCGHTADQHIYSEGACRPGFECDEACDRFAAALSVAGVRRRAGSLALEEGVEDDGLLVPESDPLGRYLLVETVERDGSSWVTMHDTLADAAEYHTRQEDRSCRIVRVHDLLTGVIYYPASMTIEWKKVSP